MVKALDRKLLRDLRHLWGQVLTIALVVACGIASYVTMQTTWVSLEISTGTYYDRYRFPDGFVHLKRAPDAVRFRLEQIPGVAEVYTRIVQGVTLPMRYRVQPPIAEVVSLPDGGQPPLDRLLLSTGRMPRAGRADEAVLLEKFAETFGLAPGDTIPVVINGELRRVLVVGLGTSPAYIYPVPRGGTAGVDDARFAVLWMDHRAIAPVFQLEGAFNDALLKLQPGASEAAVLQEVDRILDPWGGYPAVGRARHPSHDILDDEMEQLRTWATVVPLIFLGISAFLVNVVLSRLVSLQRPEIASLKALGYRNREIGLHYLKLVTVVVLLGAVIGIGVGAWLGSLLTGLYASIFRLPFSGYALGWKIPLVAAALSFLSAVVGAVSTVRGVVLLPPAEAMRPPAPPVYRPLLAERLGIPELVSPAGRMVARELERRPIRTLLSVLALGTGMATLIVGRFAGDAFDYLIEQEFAQVMREDLTVAFYDPVDYGTVYELSRLPGVLRAEGIRVAPVRVEAGHRYREVPVYGLADGAELRQVVSRAKGEAVPLPADGMLITRTLGEILDIAPGQAATFRSLEGERRTYRVPVAGTVDELMGLQGYMRLSRLNRLLREPPTISAALLRVEASREHDIIARLHQRPGVASVTRSAAVVESLREQSGESMDVVTLVLTIFAITIATGTVYNNARVALSLRGRDFASLRVLGFTRGEISRTLLSELGAQVVLAIPVGFLLGTWLTWLVIGIIHPERYRFPMIITPAPYAFAALVVVLAAAASGLIVRRRLDRLDLIGVLKTRE